MQAAQYPRRTCREGLFNSNGLAYTCELVDLHPGPCASFSIAASVTRRDAWEKANPEWESQIGSSDTIV